MIEQPKNADYDVGYGRPPRSTRFCKGQSGNPGGRPRGMTAGRANALALKEAYRMVPVKVGDSIVLMPAIQALLRGQVALAAKGNGPAQRAVFEKVQAIERELAALATAEETKTSARPVADRDLARRIAWVLSGATPHPDGENETKAPPETAPVRDEEEQ